MFATTACDPTTGMSSAVPIAPSPETPPAIPSADEIVTAISKVLAPGHHVPG